MGNNETKQQENLIHAVYGEPHNLINVNGQKFHTVPFPIKQQQDGKEFINNSNITETFSKKHLLISTNFNMQKVFMCSNSQILSCTFPFYPYSLSQQIEQRQKQSKYLTKQQLFNLTYQIIDGARNFDRINEKVGDIRPSNILLDQSKKNIKLINWFTSPNQLTGLQKTYQTKQKTLLVQIAPQQLKSLQKNNPNPQINVHKADSFSLGLTILSIGNLKHLQTDLYNYESHSFSWTQLNHQLQIFENRYGHFLTQIIKCFIPNQSRNRLYIGQIGSILQFYEKHIYQLLAFEPDYVLLEKSYDLNYSGPRSEEFMVWLNSCKNYSLVKKQVITIKPHIVNLSTPPKFKQQTHIRYNNNVKVRFQYTSPSVIKSQFNKFQ